jgi:hypothetical protein
MALGEAQKVEKVNENGVGQAVDFSNQEIVLRLHDRDDSGLLFEKRF